MGGRGASSGMSDAGNPYASQYHTVLQEGDIKFVKKNTRQSESLMETMTEGRIYAEVGGDQIIRVVMFDENNRRNLVIEFDKRRHKWHVHRGYFHTEYGENAHDDLSDSDQKLLANIINIWENRNKV